MGRTRAAIATVAVSVAAGGLAAGPAQAALLGMPVATAASNPTPLTDLFASTLPPLTGGTQRLCTTSGRGIPVHCVENVQTMPSAEPSASGVTFGHWIYCKRQCRGSLLAHEMVHVGQFETYGDTFGPMYLVEAALHGTGCENKWERPAYEASGGC
jgi:hypothetical protein